MWPDVINLGMIYYMGTNNACILYLLILDEKDQTSVKLKLAWHVYSLFIWVIFLTSVFFEALGFDLPYNTIWCFFLQEA